MADAATQGQGIERPDPDLLDPTKAFVSPTESGGALVNFDGEPPADAPELGFSDDLTPLFDPQQLGRLGTEAYQLFEQDDRSRADWRTTYARGLELLGLKYEERTEPWAGACGAFHPMLLESVIRFNAQAMMDLFPPSGPIKSKVIGRITPEKERQAERVSTDLNWLATEQITGFREETDMMLFNLPLAGTTFRKWRFDETRQVPAAEYVLPEHVVMPYAAASLASTDRFAVILPKTTNWIEAKMASGFYRTVEIGKGIVKSSDITEKKDKIEGKSNTNTADDWLHRLIECNYDWYFPEDTENTSGLPKPYLITIDEVSRKVLSIRRNWRQGDPAMARQVNLVQHKYMPGFGPYGIGLVNILGGLTDSATSILRQLVDAGTLANLPAGYKTKQARVKDDSSPIGPGEWRDVDVGSGALREAFFPLPYGEPSTVLAALLGQIVDEGRRIGSVADMKVTDMTGQNMPVGTTLAIIERSMKVMSAVQQRLYESFKNEYKVLSEIVLDFMGNRPYEFELDQRDAQATRALDYGKQVDVIPVADPGASTMAQRIMVMQAIIQLTQTAPQVYNLKNVHRDMITVLGSDKADFYIPPDEEVQPRDPVTENMDLLTGKPVRAGLTQDHAAHIIVHTSAAEDPKIIQLLTNNPAAPSIMAAANAHVLEHVAFQMREEIEAQLGTPLPPPGEPLPEDVEYQLSRLTAAAAEKVLRKHQAEEQQKEVLEKLEDPIVQIQQREVAVKEEKAQTDRLLGLARLDQEARDKQIEVMLAILREMFETERSTLAVEVQKGAAADEMQMRHAEIAADLGKGAMGEIGKLLIAKVNAAAKGNRQ